jgi:hypothetical protein
MVLSQTIEIGQVYEVQGYGYPMVVERMDRMVPVIVKSVTLRPATCDPGRWRLADLRDVRAANPRESRRRTTGQENRLKSF